MNHRNESSTDHVLNFALPTPLVHVGDAALEVDEGGQLAEAVLVLGALVVDLDQADVVLVQHVVDLLKDVDDLVGIAVGGLVGISNGSDSSYGEQDRL